MNDLSKRNLVAEAEALEANATVAEHAAKSQHADAERWRAEAAKLREQAAREPLRLWVNYGAGMPAYAYTSESDARHNASMARTRIAVPMAEVRPVRITDAELLEKWTSHVLVGHSELAPRLRAFINALSLAGMEVEK